MTIRTSSINASLFKSLFFATLTSGLCSCGGGGGGGDTSAGPGDLSISESPSTVDVGDNAKLDIGITNVTDSNIALKVRFPKELSYVPESGFLTVGNSASHIAPTNNQSDADYTYLVFYISKTRFVEGSGDVSLNLKVGSQIASAEISADLDVDDPLISNATEFDVNNPAFSAVDRVTVEIRKAN